MKNIKFIIQNIGSRCGYVTCENKGLFPAYSFEQGNRGVWVTCGKSHA